jgi:hypothetical protein
MSRFWAVVRQMRLRWWLWRHDRLIREFPYTTQANDAYRPSARLWAVVSEHWLIRYRKRGGRD